MSKVLVSDTYLKDIGNAIRSRAGGTAKYKPGQMAEAISKLPAQGYHVSITQSPNQKIILEYRSGASGTTTNNDVYLSFSPVISNGLVEVDDPHKYIPGELRLMGMGEGVPSFPMDVTSDLTFYATPATPVPLRRVDLSNYASVHIPNYQTVTTIPATNLDYLRSGLKATNMMQMFYNCNALTTIPNLGIDTSECDNVFGLCYDCESLTSVDLSWADTSNVNDFGYMFSGCRNLQTINGVIDMSSCTHYERMFVDCTKLRGVKLRNLPKGVTPKNLGLTEGQYTIV